MPSEAINTPPNSLLFEIKFAGRKNLIMLQKGLPIFAHQFEERVRKASAANVITLTKTNGTQNATTA